MAIRMYLFNTGARLFKNQLDTVAYRGAVARKDDPYFGAYRAVCAKLERMGCPTSTAACIAEYHAMRVTNL